MSGIIPHSTNSLKLTSYIPFQRLCFPWKCLWWIPQLPLWFKKKDSCLQCNFEPLSFTFRAVASNSIVSRAAFLWLEGLTESERGLRKGAKTSRVHWPQPFVFGHDPCECQGNGLPCGQTHCTCLYFLDSGTWIAVPTGHNPLWMFL